MLVACSSLVELDLLKKLLSSEFDMKDLGDVKKVHCKKIFWDRSNEFLYLSQKRYIEKALKRFLMDNFKIISIPHGSHFLISRDHCPQTKQKDDDTRYILHIYIIE